MPVSAPAGGVLSFASPKESTQRKGDPDAALILRAEAFERGCQKGLPSPSVNAMHPCIAPVGCSVQKLRCSARQTGEIRPHICG